MGATLSSLSNMMFAKKKMTIVMVGLGAAGKTSILYKLKLGHLDGIDTTNATIGAAEKSASFTSSNLVTLDGIDTTNATIGFNADTIEYKDVSILVWDVGGQTRIESWWWRHAQVQGLIFVVDSSNRDRFTVARDDLHRMLCEDETRDAPLLVFANKQDLPNVMSVSEITDKLGLHSLGQRRWHIQAACATSGEGLEEGLDWLYNNTSSKA